MVPAEKTIEQYLRLSEAGRKSRIAESVLRLSDFYIKFPDKQTPWHEPWALEAYLSYYFFLNYARFSAVFRRYLQVRPNLHAPDLFVDFGAGLGNGAMAWLHTVGKLPKISFVEREMKLAKTSRQIFGMEGEWSKQLPQLNESNHTLLFAGYSLTECRRQEIPFEKFQTLVLVEPATRQDSRALLETRKLLLERGFSIIAPCLHQSDCPLLLHSKTDWCHDRVSWEQPSWYADIEKRLPMKNGTLAFSYLIAEKNGSAQPKQAEGSFRVTGDLQKFKGYAKQMICKSSDREFLTWQKRNTPKYPELNRGDLVTGTSVPL